MTVSAARAAVAAIVSVMLAGCAAAGGEHPDNAAALAAIQAAHSGGEVVVEGVVTHVARASHGDTGVHERFEIRIGSGAAEQDIEVADNITVGTAAPVQRGDDVIVKGVLEIDPAGPVIHWTHHDPSFHHAGGYVIVHGKMYD